MNEENARYEVARRDDLPITSMAEIAKAGELLAQSGMFGINNPAAGFVVVATCRQQGISLMEFARTYHIVQGKPTMRADAMVAEFRNKGGKIKILENSVTRAAAVFEFEGEKYDWEFTIDDAKRNGDALDGTGKLKSMWQKRPDDMLWARLVSRSIRKLAPEIVAGIYTPEEAQDFEPPRVSEPPKPITEDDVLARAKVVKPVSAKYDIYCYCPDGFGEFSGKAWSDIDTPMLKIALASEKIPIGCKAEIQSVLGDRAERGEA